MWIVKPSRLRAFAARHPLAAPALERWLIVAAKARWTSLSDIRRVFAATDEVSVASGRKAVIFNIGGNRFRLITAIHYNTGKVFIMLFLTHAEYDRQSWKDLL
jgi:mRNA interferase HigB